MDRELEAWSAKGLYGRLKEAEREGEEVRGVMEGGWLDGNSKGEGQGGAAEEREVEEWVRGYKEERVKWWKRREWRERWDEGRVGGWR